MQIGRDVLISSRSFEGVTDARASPRYQSADSLSNIFILMTRKRTKSTEYPSPFVEQWEPSWLVDVGNDMKVGIALDNECYVVLTQTSAGLWRPITHIPVEAAKMLGRLAGN